MNLDQMRKQLEKGKVIMHVVGAHLFVALSGWLRGGAGDRYHQTPLLASMTQSGMNIQCWVTLLIITWDEMGVQDRPLYQDRACGVLRMGVLDEILHQYLLAIHESRPKLIAKYVGVKEEFLLHECLRHGAYMQSHNKGVVEANIKVSNRWRNHKKTRGRKLWCSIMEHFYSNIAPHANSSSVFLSDVKGRYHQWLTGKGAAQNTSSIERTRMAQRG